MLKNASGITNQDLNKMNEDFAKNPLNKVAQNAASLTPLSKIVFDSSKKVGMYHQFSIDIKTMSATYQKQSGRCWIFAGTNVLREIVAKKLNLASFELSQNFVAYYDKLEKINYLLESVIDLLDREQDDRTLQCILRDGVGDGGQWDMFKALIKKYGVCPKNVMDESCASSATRDSSFVINRSIRKFAGEARRLHEQGRDAEIKTLKEEVLNHLHHLITVAFGSPVTKFDFEYVDKDGAYHIEKDLTPLAFYEKYIGLDINEYVSIINSPTQDKPFYETFTVDYIGNVIGAPGIHYLNLPMEELKELCVKQLKDGEVVWFGSDCGKYGDRENGVWDPALFDYKTTLGIDLEMQKNDMLDYGESAMNHAMVITGVNLEEDIPTKWKIENSWGTEAGIKGYYTASDLWFDYFVYQAVINKKHLSEKQLKALSKKPKHLNPWDPMGTLAD